MNEMNSMNVNEWGWHSLSGILQMTNKKWIVAGATVLLCLVWTTLPFGSTEAQGPPPPVPALVAGPVAIRGATPSPSADGIANEHVMLMATNVGEQAVQVRLAIRDATNSRVLATSTRMLQPGEGTSLTYSERTNPFRNVIGIVSPGPESGPWSVAGRVGSFAAALSVVDDSTNTTRVALETKVVSTRIGAESQIGRR
jgi:hypothetical protein